MKTAAFIIAVIAAGAALMAAPSRRAQPQPTVVDSVVPREIALEQFRSGLARPDSLTGGLPSRDALVGAFARAVEASDTAALRSMVMTRAEFAWLYYPTSPEALPPYDLSPQLMWFTLETHSRQGLDALLRARQSEPLNYLGYRCQQVHGPCLVRHRDATGTIREDRLFGLIIERAGRFKFVSYANDVD